MRTLVALIALAGTAAAETTRTAEGELAAGTSAVGAVGAVDGGTSSLAVANARFLAHVVRTPRPLDERGLHLCGLDGEGCLWVFTSIEPAETDGAGALATAQLQYAATGDSASTLQLDGRAWAGVGGWRIEGRAAFQPTTTLRDRFWRSNRGVLQTNVAIAIPSMWSLGTRGAQLAVGSATLDFGTRTQRADGGWEDAGFDRDYGLLGMRFQMPELTVDLFTLKLAELGADSYTSGRTTYGTSVTSIDLDILAAEVRLPHAIALAGRVGVADRTPAAPFETTGSSTRVYGPGVFSASYWVEARLGVLADAREDVAFTLGGGSWSRLDPTGHAVDTGQLASAAVLVRRDRLTVRADLQLGRLRRVLEGALAPPGLVPLGTRMVMGRGALEASYTVTRALSITSGGWVEHSDRDDPRWAASTAGPAMHTGGELVAAYAFGRVR